jgi:microcystin-dependent protein
MALTPCALASEPFVGEIQIFAGNFAPRGYAFCDGQLLQIAQNTALFSLLGTTYGGDGRTTVGLPNLQGRAAMHTGRGPGLTNRTLGQVGGQEDVTLTTSQMPSHSHSALATDARGDDVSPEGNIWARRSRDRDYSDTAPNVSMSASALTSVGGGQSHTNMQPYLTLHYIIALQGTYPSRS